MSDAPVLFEVTGAVATITLNRPKHGNTINMPVAEALLRAALQCESDPRIRAVILTGKGSLFCGGGDITAFEAADEDVPVFISELAGKLHMTVSRLLRMHKPLIVLANGPAAGAGLSLVLAGDISLATPKAHFTTAYGQVGLSPDGGMSWLLPRTVGLRHAQQMLLTNRRVNATEAADIGIISRVVAEDGIYAEGNMLAAELATGATCSIGATRNLLLDSYDGALEAQLERETRSITRVAGTKDCHEGVSAFLGRRKPEFQGK